MFFKAWRQIAGGKTLMRALMNIELSGIEAEHGLVVDIGGGKNPSYRGFVRGFVEANVQNLDKQHGIGAARAVDFEKDKLPFADKVVDQIFLLNVLEHVYHHEFLVGEVHRVLKDGKTVVGFVPFLINYHADPHDYFRYTDEALALIFKQAGFREIKIRLVGLGPFSVNFNMLASFMPRAFNALLWPLYYSLDRLLLVVKPSLVKRFPLGYLFVLTK